MLDVNYTVICWTARHGKKPTAGRIALFTSIGAALRRQGEFSNEDFPAERRRFETQIEAAHFLLSNAVGMIVRDGLDPQLVHEALLNFPAYRNAVPMDLREDPPRLDVVDPPEL